jgi:FAD/FMN-containing dehydrogenase
MKRRRFIQTGLGAAALSALPGSLAWSQAVQVLSQAQGSVDAITGSGRSVTLEHAALEELRASLRGRLLLAGQDGYEAARRVLNAGIDRNPALVVQPTGAADVMQAVDFARERELLLAVKCGGHSYGGKSTCDGGLQIDLSRMRHARIDPARRKAYIAGGSLLGELDHEAMSHGLVTTAGTVSHTGVGGLTLGGGFGRLARRFGLALDNVTAVDIVTADGRLRHASAGENADLYWAVRGGGGNFGVVTQFEFALHPMERNIIGGDLVFPLARLRDVLNFYADFARQAPDDLYVDLIAHSALGTTDGVVLLHVCYSGPAQRADTVLAPLRELGTPIQDTLRTQDYVAIQRSMDDTDPRNNNEYMKSGFVNEFPRGLVEAIVDGFTGFEERSTTLVFQHAGGAIARVPGDATAFAQRGALANMLYFIEWPLAESPEAHVAYIREQWQALEPFTDGWYSNEVANENPAAINRNYQGNYPRLVELKTRYDPGNLFRLNANITPAP